MIKPSKPQLDAAIDVEAFQWAQFFNVTDIEAIEDRKRVMRANVAVGHIEPLLKYLPPPYCALPNMKSETMHPILADEIVKVCRARSSEGDCPTTPAESVERLEQCVIELANQLQVFSADEPAIEAYKLFRKERQAREAAEQKLKEQAANEPAHNNC